MTGEKDERDAEALAEALATGGWELARQRGLMAWAQAEYLKVQEQERLAGGPGQLALFDWYNA
jgi:hypothetical protein